MNFPPHSTEQPSLPLMPPPAPRWPYIEKLRKWLRSRTGRIVLPIIALILGIFLGIFSLILYGLTGEGRLVNVPSSNKGDLVVEVDKTLITALIAQNLQDTGMPGTIENVTVDLENGDLLTINGDDVISMFGIGVAKHFTLVVQPYVQFCVLQIHVIHADLTGIPVTGFVQSFETSINQQLLKKPTGLPGNFTYCTTGVRTTTAGMFITYTATAPTSTPTSYSLRNEM